MALKKAQRELQGKLIDDICSMGYSQAYVERALELPQRTIARWKNGDVSAANLALLRILKTVPQFIDIADRQFAKMFVMAELTKYLKDQYKSVIDNNGIGTSVSVNKLNSNTISFNVDFILSISRGKPRRLGRGGCQSTM